MRAIVAAPPRRTLAAAAADRDLHRAARLRAARPAVGRCRPQARRASCAPARRPLRQDRAAEVGGGRAHRAAAADGGHRAARAPPRLSQERAGPRVPQQPGRHRAPQHHRRARLSSGAGRGRRRRSATARRNITACTACATSMPRGASTGASMAGSNCRSRWCRRGSGTPRSR